MPSVCQLPLRCSTPVALHSHQCFPHQQPAVRRPYTPVINAVNNSAIQLVSDKTFKCTECGKCCTGAGEVWVNEEECSNIAEHLKLDSGTFKHTYCKSYDSTIGWRALKYKPGPAKDCIFLSDKLCTIYNVRPTQCQTYPWWPDLMNPAAWQAEAATVCEGFDHEDAGRLDANAAASSLLQAAEYFAAKDAAPRRSTKQAPVA